MKRAFLLSLALILAGCSGFKSCSTKTAGTPETLVINNYGEPTSLDPVHIYEMVSAPIVLQMFQGLTELHPQTLEVMPGVATDWKVSGDGLTYTYYLRKNAKWSNGDPVTAHDFEYSWKRALDPKTGVRFAPILFYLENGQAFNEGKADANTVGVTAVDDYTLVVKLRAPTPFFEELSGFYTYFPVHQKTVETFGDDWTKPENIVCNGPYKLVHWIPQKEVLLEKNSYFWDASNVKIAKAAYLPLDDLHTALKKYLNGESHFNPQLPTLEIRGLKDRPDFHSQAEFRTYFITINTARKPFDDIRVRKAFAMAIDKERIVETLGRGDLVADAFVPPGMSGYISPSGLPYDPVAAKALLTEAGFGDPSTFPHFTFLYNTDENHKLLAEQLQNMWKENLGIDIAIQNMEYKSLLKVYEPENHDFGLLRWIGDYLDPHTFLDMFTSTSDFNHSNWSSETYDSIVTRTSFEERDQAKRFAMLSQAEKIFVDEVPAIPLYHSTLPFLLDPRVKGIYGNLTNDHPIRYAYFEE